MARELKVEIVGDASSFNRALGSAGKGADTFGSKLVKVGKIAATAGAAIAAGVGIAAVKSIDAASDLSEQLNKTAVVFGKNGREVSKWSESLATSFGLSQRAALEAAGTYGNMLVPMGFSRKEAAGMSQQFVELAADMASFNNADPSETLDALRAGLAGETEPLRRFGVFLNDARIKSQAASMGFKLVKGQLDPMAKAAATAAIIMKDTSDTQGDFGRTSGSLANQQRILRAQLENSAASIGRALLPAATKVLQVVNAGIPIISKFGGKVVDAVGPTVTKLAGGFADAFGNIATKVGPSLEQFVGRVQAAIPGIVAVFGPLIAQIGKTLIPIFQALADIGGRAIAGIGKVLQENGPQIRQIFENLGTVIGTLAKVILPILDVALTKVLPVALRTLIPILVLLTGAIAKVAQVIGPVAQVITGVLVAAITTMIGVVKTVAAIFTTAFNGARTAVQTAVNAIRPIIDSVAMIIRGVVNIVKGIFTGDWARVWQGMKQIAEGFLRGLIAYVTTLPSILLGLALKAGQAIVTGITNGLQALPGAIRSGLSVIAGALASVASSAAGWAAGIGRAIIQGIISGFGGLLGQLKSSLENSIKSVVSSLNPFSPVEHGGEIYIGRPLAEGAIKGWLEGSAELPAKVSDKIKEAVQAGQDAISSAKGAFATAFDDLAQSALAAFDKLASEIETRSEKRLREMEERRSAQARQRAKQEALDAVAAAQAEIASISGQKNEFGIIAVDPAKVQQAQANLKSAQQQLADAQYEIDRANLEKRAALERQKLNERQELNRQHFANQLAAVQQSYANGAISAETFHKRLIALFKQYHIPYQKGANELGLALAEGLNNSFKKVSAAANALAQEVLNQFSRIRVIINVELSTKGDPGKKLPRRASGGYVRGNTAYIVGEVGPELFVPGVSGRIVSNADMQNGGAVGGWNAVNVIVYGDVTGQEIIDKVREGLLNINLYNPGSAVTRA